MASVNEVRLLGHLGKNPELRYTQSQYPVCNFSLATNEYRKDSNGNKTEFAEWHQVVVWGKQAENCSKYLKKGSKAYVGGRLQTRTWEDKGEKKYTTEIVASNVQYLDSKGEQSSELPPQEASVLDHDLDSIPF